MNKVITILSEQETILYQKSETVAEFDQDICMLVERLSAIVTQYNGIGLAAPQTGINKAVFVTRLPDEKIKVYVNPSILYRSDDKIFYEEGCLSIPHVYAQVQRPESIEIEAKGIDGRTFTKRLNQLEARVFQHELDHLEGRLFIDLLSTFKRQRILKHYQKLQEN